MKRDIATAEILQKRIKQKIQKLEHVEPEKEIKVYTKEQVIAAYKTLGNIGAVCTETGCPPYIAYKWLKMAKALNSHEATRYGTNGQKQGAKAELEFQRLVPFAMSANKELESNCPSFDFDINGTTIDVKFSSMCDSNGTYRFMTAQGKHMRPDYYCAFLPSSGDKELSQGKYRILIIPDQLVSGLKGVTIQKEGGKYWDFEVKPEALADFFRDYLGPETEEVNP